MGAKLIAGLGNPGSRYDGTRHNLGFVVVDALAGRLDSSWNSNPKLKSMLATARHRSERLILLKPLTYMNVSGEAIGPACRFYDVELEDLLVVVDDVSLPVGRMRFRGGGSSGGHNGLRDIERALGTKSFPRLRLGVAPVAGARNAPPAEGAEAGTGLEKREAAAVDGSRMKGFVLGRFNREESETLAHTLPVMQDAVLHWAAEGMQSAMNRFNTDPDKKARKSRPPKASGTGESEEQKSGSAEESPPDSSSNGKEQKQ